MIFIILFTQVVLAIVLKPEVLYELIIFRVKIKFHSPCPFLRSAAILPNVNVVAVRAGFGSFS